MKEFPPTGICLLSDKRDFFSAWHIYNNINLIPNTYFAKTEKIVYKKSAKEQHMFMPQQLLMFPVSLFLTTSGENS